MIAYKKVDAPSDVLKLIRSFSEEFSTLSSRVELSEYAAKLAENASVIAMQNDKECIGMAAVYMNDVNTKTAYISLIGIKEIYQGNGYGKLLLDFLIAEAKKAEMEKIRLEVDGINKKAQSFYFKCGFEIESHSDRNSMFLVKDIV